MKTIDLDAMDDIACKVKLDGKEYKILFPTHAQVKAWNKEAMAGMSDDSDKDSDGDPTDIIEQIRKLVGTIATNIPKDILEKIKPHKLYPIYRTLEKVVRDSLNPTGIEITDEEIKNAVREKMKSTSLPVSPDSTVKE